MAGRRGTYQDRDDIDEDEYSDDFLDDDDDDDFNDTGTKRYKTRSPILRTDKKGSKASRNSDGQLRSNRSNRGRGRGRGSQLNTGRSSMDPNNVAKRVLSARRLKINELMNQNNELKQNIIEIREENRLLKKTQRRSDKALQKFEDQENDLPTLIQRQNNEVRSLKDQIRKWREKFEKTDRYLRDAEDELEKSKVKLKKLKSLADEKDLPERGDLNRKLNQSELEIEAKDVKIRELEKHLKHLEKNHRHEIGIERARQKDVNNQLLQLREENEKLQTNVKEKEKEIQMKNIYANRMVKPPHRLPNSYSGTPHDTPPPRKRRPSEGDGVTPRDRAKQMEMKRREEMRKHRELKQRKLKRDNYLNKQTTPRQGNDHVPLAQYTGDMSPRSPRKTEHADKLKKEQERRRQQEEDEEYDRKRQKEREERELEMKERLLNEQADREDEERRNKLERQRMKREAEEREIRERERKEMEERTRKEKREREERERRERERKEQEKRAQEDRKRIEEDESFQHERKKKDEILQKLREIDEGGQKNKDVKNGFNNDPFFVTEGKENSEDSMNSKKDWAFTKPTENLHKGKPARRNDSFNTSYGGTSDKRKVKKETDSVEIGGYNPSFAGRSDTNKPKTFSLFDDEEPKGSTYTAKPANKAKLLEDLFGSKDDNKSSANHDIFAPKPPPPKKTSGSVNRSSFPWDDGSTHKSSASTMKTKRENSSTLFGGGNAFVNDEEIQKSTRQNATLPRHQKLTTTAFHSRPTVNAIDTFDDDIEEVIL